jgi:hypothetical protein
VRPDLVIGLLQRESGTVTGRVGSTALPITKAYARRVLAAAARVFPLVAFAALAFAMPAAAGIASDARVSGQYRVVYVKVAGQGPASAGGNHVWAAVPKCPLGTCSLRIRSRAEGGKTGYPLPFDFDGTTYQNVGSYTDQADCGAPGDATYVGSAYDSKVLSRFRVTRMSASGRALVFKGSYSVRYTLNARGRGHSCGDYYTDTERYTGYAITAP